jgi:hypothetical protein
VEPSTSGGSSVGIVPSRTEASGFSLYKLEYDREDSVFKCMERKGGPLFLMRSLHIQTQGLNRAIRIIRFKGCNNYQNLKTVPPKYLEIRNWTSPLEVLGKAIVYAKCN